MQYLLTETEYNNLIAQAKKKNEKQKKELQELCTLAAMHVPIEVSWIGKPVLWGCILGPEEQNSGCCDDCPSLKVCPYEHKEFSQ
jgi:hypothetical protein